MFKFIKYGFYELWRKLGKKDKWEDMDELKEYRDEIMKQIDIETIIKRLIFLEHSITYLLDDFQMEGLQLQRPVTAKEIKRLRERCNLI